MKTSNDMLRVSEHFYSIQGEGQTMGRPAYFLRLTHCNLLCGGAGTQTDGQLHSGATWRCDSIEVWQRGTDMSFEQIVEAMGGKVFLRDLDCGVHLIITGGEPLMQQEAIVAFLLYLHQFCTPIVEIETNGTIVPVAALSENLVHYWNVSPKLSNSGMREALRINLDAIKELSRQGLGVIFKFVVSSVRDWDAIQQDFGSYIDNSQIWLMPAADNRNTLEDAAAVAIELAKKHRVSYSHRIHIAVWDKKTGV